MSRTEKEQLAVVRGVRVSRPGRVLAALATTLLAALGSAQSVHATRLAPVGDLELQGPGLSVAIGGVGLGGLGTVSNAGQLSVTIRGPVRKAFLYWGGRGVLPGDSSVLVEGDLIEGVLIGSEPAPAATSFAYRADVTAMVQAEVDPPQKLTWTVADPTPGDPATTLDGASLFVVYDDLDDPTPYHLSVYEGSDFAWAPNLPDAAGFTEPVTFIAVPEAEPRLGELFLVVGDAYPTRPDRIDISNNPVVVDELDASDGNQWDSDLQYVTLPANTNSLSVELISPPEFGPPADSMNWILAALRIPVEGNSDGFTGACCLGEGVCMVLSVDGCVTLDGAFQGPSTTCAPNPCPQPVGACCMSDGGCSRATAAACLSLGGVYQGNDTTCTPELCVPATGACCLPDASCFEDTSQACQSAGGAYQGDGTSCSAIDCPEPTGACCFRDGSCGVGKAFDCLVGGGVYQGDGSNCDSVECSQPTGACCLSDGSCVDTTAADCGASGGDYQGDGVGCVFVQCPEPSGACCLVDGSCVITTQVICESMSGTFQGAATTCVAVECPQPTGACCLDDGSCVATTSADCVSSGGDYQGDATTCDSVNCPQPVGACCLQDGACINTTQQMCTAMSGTFQGAATTCVSVECLQPTGACCLDDGSCVTTTSSGCVSSGGDYQGDATTCDAVSCPQPVGACCLDDGSCINATQQMCTAMGGSFQGADTACDSVQCPQPTGACCLDDGSCVETTAAACSVSGGDYQGDDVACAAVSCPQPNGACCLSDGSCVEATSAGCAASSGTYQGNFTTCVSVSCPQPTGACCLDDGSCVETTAADCAASSGDYQGDFVACAAVSCPQPTGACCLIDGSCVEGTAADCSASSGTYQGNFTTCVSVSCPQPTGACCLDDGSCVEVTAADCVAASGEYEGDFSSCVDVRCPEPILIGACCMTDGSCQVLQDEECEMLGGRFQGDDTMCGTVECPQPTAGGCAEKGSLLVFSKVDVRWDVDGNVLQDTFIDLTNDYPETVQVLMYFINGDAPMDKCDKLDPKEAGYGAPYCDDSANPRRHPGWNWVDNEIKLTKNQPVYWSAATGLPAGVSPWSVLDPGPPVGRPAGDGTTDRVLRGYVLAWAVDVEGREIRWNHLKGDATIIDYRTDSAWEYNACGYQVVDPAIANGQQTGTPGVINLDGSEYGPVYDMLLMDFYAHDSMPFGDSGISVVPSVTLHPMEADLRQETDGPVTTKAHFEIWNMNEVKFSGTYRCITCWDQTLLVDYGVPNHFLKDNLQTDKGKARIDGLASALCDYDNNPKDQRALGDDPNDVVSRDAALMGVAHKRLVFGNPTVAMSGTNLHGMGTQSATIRYDILELPPEQQAPGDFLREMLEAIDNVLRPSLRR